MTTNHRIRILIVSCCCWLLASASIAWCGDGIIEGRTVDHNSIGLPGVTISVNGPVDHAVLSGPDGVYRLKGLPAGRYTVTATMPGFATLEENVEITEEKPLILDFRLVQAFQDTVVVSASGAGVALEDAPTTVSVIDESTIETTAARNVGDLLRAVPGVNVIQSSARDVNVASRQSSTFLTGSQLAMVDGRPLYFDFFNVVFWDLIGVPTPDIQQIEVVRGPASAMWGANAATGVVNIVTKAPRDSRGLLVTLDGGVLARNAEAGGTGSMGSAAVSWTDAPSDTIAYRISASYYSSDPFERPTGILEMSETPIKPAVEVGGGSFDDVVYHNQGTKQPKFDLRVDQELGGDGKIVYGAGFSQTQGIIHTPIGPFELLDNTRLGYGQVNYSRGGFHANLFANYLSGDAPALVSVDGNGDPLEIDFTNGVYNLDLGWRDLFFNRHLMTFGGNIRYNTFDISIAPDADLQRQIGVYVQDEIDLGPLHIAAALRADDFDNFSGVNVSPRLALIWTPAAGHTVKLSYNRGFRTPSAIDNYMDISITGGYFPVSEFDPSLEEDFPIVVRTIGNPDLQPETIDAYEIGYSAVLGNGATRFDLNLYTSTTTDVISYSPSPEALEEAGIDPFYSSENPPPGWPLHPIVLDFLEIMGVRFPSTIQILNIGSIRNRGLEFSARHSFGRGWALWGNYSFQDIPEMLDPIGDPLRPPSESVSVPPKHRFNLGLAFDSDRYLGSVTVNYSDRAFFAQGLNPTFLGYSDAYTLVGLTLGKRWMDGDVTTSIKVINALDEKARQHVFGDILRRSVIFEVQFRY